MGLERVIYAHLSLHDLTGSHSSQHRVGGTLLCVSTYDRYTAVLHFDRKRGVCKRCSSVLHMNSRVVGWRLMNARANPFKF